MSEDADGAPAQASRTAGWLRAVLVPALNIALAFAVSGLVVVASEDHYVGTETMARQTAERAGALVSVLDGVGHWWMLQDPTAGAAALRSFWKELS